MLVIGVGNPYRKDDRAGLAVARAIRKAVGENVEVLELSGEGSGLIEAWKAEDKVWVVDAVSSGGKPGTIYRFDTAREMVPSSFFSYSTHAFSVAEAVELARVLDQLPKQLVIYGIEGKNFEMGEECSPAVEKAIEDVMKKLLEELCTKEPSLRV